jgi:hypothetical protein
MEVAMRLRTIRALAVAALSVLGLALAGPDQAKADSYTLDLHCGPCGTIGPFGTVTVTTVSGGIDLKIVLAQGDFNGSGNGIDTVFFNDGSVSGTGGGGVIQYGSTGTSDTTDWSVVLGTLKTDGLSDGTWTAGFDCNHNGGNCGQVFEVLIPTALIPQPVSGNSVYIGVDVTCGSNATDKCSNVGSFNTGAVGALLTPVPFPIAGVGLPGMMAGCLGLLALARRRRQQLAP